MQLFLCAEPRSEISPGGHAARAAGRDGPLPEKKQSRVRKLALAGTRLARRAGEKMRISDFCANCLFDRQKELTDNGEYLEKIKNILDNRDSQDTAPYISYCFNEEYKRFFGTQPSYGDVKKKYNDMMLGIEQTLREKIEASDNPIALALAYARVGNYIDYAAMKEVDDEVLVSLFDDARLSDDDMFTLNSFMSQCKKADKFLLLADNSGEIVLDKLFLEQLRKAFPYMQMAVMVRGSEIVNDVTTEDAYYSGIDRYGDIVSSGIGLAGTVYSLLSDEGRKAFDAADVILSKGQGNYESLCGNGHHVFYAFLCKCEVFTRRFGVSKLTGMFVEEV